MKVREPVARPLDVIAAELLLSASQAFLGGVLLYLAVGLWGDRGVGFGPVAVVLVGLGAAIGASWLFWLMGGVGWPLAAANVPTAMFLGFALVLGWRGEDLFRVEGVPLFLSLAASVYGIACGVFLDSPRRWRWDQRQRPRPGTSVPRVSPATRTLAAAVPRTLPKRPTAVTLVADGERESTGGMASGPDGPVEDQVTDELGHDELASDELGRRELAPSQGEHVSAGAEGADADLEDSIASVPPPGVRGLAMPTQRLDEAARSAAPSTRSEPDSSESPQIELPTAIEPKAQRSPWAWAAPPEWNRDEDDEPLGGGGSSGSQ